MSAFTPSWLFLPNASKRSNWSSAGFTVAETRHVGIGFCKLIDQGEDRQKVAALFKVGRKTLYRALAA
jgi:hypothetical protein